MKIADIMKRNVPSLSFEIFPPKSTTALSDVKDAARRIAALGPSFMSVTYGAGGTTADLTVELADAVQNEFHVTSLAHMTCRTATRESVLRQLDGLRRRGIENVLALRGDHGPGREVKDFTYAKDLIVYLKDSGLCIGAACYPEGHVECQDFTTSIEHLKQKQDAGADFLVSQLFFDNEYFYRFREACDRARVKLPISVGIMPFTSVKQIQRMSFTCGASIPSAVIKRLVAAGDDSEAQRQAGVEYACEQLVDLAANGVDGLHIYTMNRPSVAEAVHDALVTCGYLAE